MAIIGSLPVSLQNGTLADATQVMSDFNFIVTAVNANAAALSGGNTFTGNQSITGTVTASGVITGASFVPTSTTVPANGMYLVGANDVGIASNTTLRWDVSSTGTHTFAAPSSGTTLAIAGLDGQVGINYVAGGVSYALAYESGSNAFSGTTSNHPWNLLTNNNIRMTVAAAGNVTINAPSSGVTMALAQVAGSSTIDAVTSLSGSAVNTRTRNSSNTASSDAYHLLQVAGASAGDAFVYYNISSTTDWTQGIDNSDSDTFKLSHNGSLGTNDYWNVTTDGRWYGTALHNNAGSVTGTTNQYIASGTYTPTLTNTTNVASSNFTDSGTTKWIRVGNVVTVSGGNLNITPTAASGTQTVLDISLPIASTLGLASACAGTASDGGGPNAGSANTSGMVQGSTANNRAQLVFEANNTNSQPWWFTFTYTVL